MKIAKLAIELNIPENDIRMILMDTNPKFETVSDLTKEEEELIRGAYGQKQLGSTEMIYHDGGSMSVEDKNAIVMNASQVLNHKLELEIVDSLRYNEYLEECRNMATIEIRNRKRRELAEVIQQDTINERNALLNIMKSIEGMLPQDTKVSADLPDSNQELTVFMTAFKAKLNR